MSKEVALEAISHITSHINVVAGESSRWLKASSTRRFELPGDVRRLLREKNVAVRAYDRYGTVNNRSNLRCLCRELKERMAQLREIRWDNLMEDISPSDTAFWKLARALKS